LDIYESYHIMKEALEKIVDTSGCLYPTPSMIASKALEKINPKEVKREPACGDCKHWSLGWCNKHDTNGHNAFSDRCEDLELE